jgi:hypothetical protein
MDRDGFMRSLEGLDRYMTEHIYIFTIGISGINGQVESVGHKKTSSERHSRTGKEKPSAEAISSEGHC